MIDAPTDARLAERRDLAEWLDIATLARRAEQERRRYRMANPFPHCVLDGLFPGDLLRAVNTRDSDVNRTEATRAPARHRRERSATGQCSGRGPGAALRLAHDIIMTKRLPPVLIDAARAVGRRLRR